jgi:hypothetical protein
MGFQTGPSFSNYTKSCLLDLGVVMGSKFYTKKFKDQIGLGSDSISIHF